jgi:flagellar hook-associated protein 2
MTTTTTTNPATSSTATLLASLGAGSGLDVNALVTELAAAQKQPREDLITARTTANQAKVSSLAQISNGIDTFASALGTLISGGSLFSQPSVSDTSVFTASAVAGASLSGLSAQVEVRQLALAQSLSSAVVSRTDPVGQGVLTLNVGGTDYPVTIDATNDNLDGLAKAINDKNAGVTASVVTDTSGARLVIKGKTGAANAFTLSVPDGTATGLERFASGTMTLAQEAKDAEIKLDGVTVFRATNSFNDLIPGVQMDLKSAKPGTTVSVGVTRPTDAINQGVQDFVSAYNELMSEITDATKMTVSADGSSATGGVLRGDLGVTALQRQLAGLPTMKLSSTGDGVHTLAEIGVSTNRDGTLSVDTTKLSAVLASDPDGVEALFNPSQYTSSPFLTVKSVLGRVAPGTYTVTNVTAAANGVAASGTLDGIAMTGTGANLVAPRTSAAAGLILGVTGNVASATITIDPGLGGALQAIRDSLRASGGPFATTQTRLSDEAKQIATDQTSLDTSSQKYYDQLLANFTAMDARVSAFKATQSYLDQQVKMWTQGNN